MRIALIDHSYHEKTRSSRFFLEIIESIGEVDIFYDETWRKGENSWVPRFVQSTYDLTIIWQVANAFDFVSKRHGNIFFVPMYDSHFANGEFYWERHFKRARCVSFCRALHSAILREGGESAYFRYFPDPSQFDVVNDFDELKAYFWYRGAISADDVFALCRDTLVRNLTIHNAPDPSQEKLSIGNFDGPISTVKISTWHDSKSASRAELLRHNLYFAPRKIEGIGFSFLEAMASGMCVVSPNLPTMNEYISNGTNGILYLPEKYFPLDLSRAREIGARARETVERGFGDWQKQRQKLIDFLVGPKSK